VLKRIVRKDRKKDREKGKKEALYFVTLILTKKDQSCQNQHLVTDAGQGVFISTEESKKLFEKW
jgi:hypothetical protein